MRRKAPAGQEIGVDLLLAGSDAFGYLADELAAEYARRHDAGDCPEVLDWARRLAELAGWWCGRLEAEADHVAGFGPEPASGRSGPVRLSSDGGSGGCDGGCTSTCRRRRRQPPR